MFLKLLSIASLDLFLRILNYDLDNIIFLNEEHEIH